MRTNTRSIFRTHNLETCSKIDFLHQILLYSGMKKSLLKTLIISLLSLFITAAYSEQPYLILSAMKKEYLPVVAKINHKSAGLFHGIHYVKGEINKTPVIATYTGIGSVNAGIVTAILINQFHPKAVIFSGVAGGLQHNINVGSVVVATKVLSVVFGQYTLHGPNFDGLPKNPIRNAVPPLNYFPSKSLLKKAKASAKQTAFKLHFGPIASDQHFPFSKANDALLEKTNIDAVAMEDIGIAHACWLYKTPFLIIRGISDNIAKHQLYTQKSAKMAAQHAAHFLSVLLSSPDSSQTSPSDKI